jgi:hypothetical protein
MQVRRQIFTVLLIYVFSSCNLYNVKKQPKKFYNSIAGWDITHIPIIEPYRATSLDKGVTWSINRPEVVNSFEVTSFGVSQNLIYGQGRAGWFLLDIKSRLYAEYETEEELLSCLKSFSVPVNAIAKCNTYLDSLAKGKNLYWFPKDGKTDPAYPNITPDAVTKINLTEDSHQQPDFRFKEKLSFKKSKVYFFQINYNQRANDLYYLSFDSSPPILVKDSLIIPVFNNDNQIEITLYTPYPIAQEKGISEGKRFLQTKTAFIIGQKRRLTACL